MTSSCTLWWCAYSSSTNIKLIFQVQKVAEFFIQNFLLKFSNNQYSCLWDLKLPDNKIKQQYINPGTQCQACQARIQFKLQKMTRPYPDELCLGYFLTSFFSTTWKESRNSSKMEYQYSFLLLRLTFKNWGINAFILISGRL